MTAKALAALILSACAYDTHFEDCAVRCTADMECPDGLTCGTEGFCRMPGATETCAAVLKNFPSCVGLAATCGPNTDEDCCSTATPIPGGTFFRSYDVAADVMYPSMSYPATVSTFMLDRFEVTIGRFRKFVEIGIGTQANPPMLGAGARFLNGTPDQGGWEASWNEKLTANTDAFIAAVKCDANYQTWTDTPGANEELPINCVTWYEAFAFCAWDGGYLPTETEWNFAAAGGDEQRAYPWSNPVSSIAIDCSYANYNPNYPSGPFCTGTGGASHVGSTASKGDGKWGQSDLGGNINEWVLDWFAPYSTTCDDCTNLIASGDRVVRGSDWINAAPTLRGAFRNHTTPTGNRDQKIGFRCARPRL